MYIGIDPASGDDITAIAEIRLYPMEVGRYEGVRFILHGAAHDWRKLDRLALKLRPKNWRWFDVFRTWPQPKILPRGIKRFDQQHRIQERFSAMQRKRLKRRAFVQKLARAH